MAKKLFKSITPIVNSLGDVVLEEDEHPRPDTTLEGLADLKPSFAMMGALAGYDDVACYQYPAVEKIQHRHHAGNSSGIVDGAAAVLLASRHAIKKHLVSL